jgi:hypothetical protein
LVGHGVENQTIFHIVKPELAERVDSRTFRFCETPTCDGVYYSTDGEVSFQTGDLRIQVGLKLGDDHSALVCYCFGYTSGMIADEIRSTGKSTVPEKISLMIKARVCACEVRNPSGRCCLALVNSFVKRCDAV